MASLTVLEPFRSDVDGGNVVTPCLDGRYSRGLLVFCVSRHSLTKEREGETQKSMDELHIACSLVFIDFMLEI